MRFIRRERRLYVKCALSVIICTSEPLRSNLNAGVSNALPHTLCVGSSQKLPCSTLKRQGVSTLKRTPSITLINSAAVADAVLTSNLFIIFPLFSIGNRLPNTLYNNIGVTSISISANFVKCNLKCHAFSGRLPLSCSSFEYACRRESFGNCRRTVSFQ